MCGIVGFTGAPDEALLERMNASQRHRGPDEGGCYAHAEAGVSLASRRLAIQDLADGQQPMALDAPGPCVVFNGEIYNAPELRRELAAKGYVFRTKCDGEVICHLYDECGEELFARLDGMFAVALWSERERKCILARDIPGEKPLYYAPLAGADLAFASEIRSLVRFPGLDLTPTLVPVTPGCELSGGPSAGP